MCRSVVVIVAQLYYSGLRDRFLTVAVETLSAGMNRYVANR